MVVERRLLALLALLSRGLPKIKKPRIGSRPGKVIPSHHARTNGQFTTITPYNSNNKYVSMHIVKKALKGHGIIQ